MRRWAFLFIFLSILVLIISISLDTAHTQESAPSYILADLKYEVYPTFSRLIFSSNEKIEFVSYELEDPYRIIIDLIGVVFCELEEHADCDKGLVKSIDVIKNPLPRKAEDLDDFFYAVDYVIITPTSKTPYRVSTAEEGKILVVDIGQEAVSCQISPIPQEKECQKTLPVISENVIDSLNYEALEESSLVVISSNKEIDFDISKRFEPSFRIILQPKTDVFTDLEEEAKIDDNVIKSLQLVKGDIAKRPSSLDEYFYPVNSIIVEAAEEIDFEVYSNEDKTIWVVELAKPQPEKPAPKIAETPEETKVRIRKEIIKELKEEIKKEGLLKEEKIEEAKKEEELKRKSEAAHMVETIGREELRDLIIKGEGILGLAQAQAIALQHSPQARTAKEEITLSRMKVREAFRALFPQAKVKGSHTRGDVLGVDFIEEVYGVQGEQAIYQGGRLWNTYKQSKVNLKLAEARYQKLVNDIDYKVAEAYYNTVTTVMNMRLQKELLREVEEVVKIAEDRREAGLSTDLEILNVRSQYNQIKFQLAGAERDLALARFKLQQAMNLDIMQDKPVADVGEVDTELRFKILDVDLYKCLELASDNQPDVLVNKLLVESNEYGEKIAKGKDNFRIDVTGFYGRSDSYYETETRDLQKDWNIGLKVSRPFWGSTASYAFTKEETSRKVGQTDRTSSRVNAGEFAILDNMPIASEIKEARINKEKAANDLTEAHRQIVLETKEAYYSYQEAIIQVKNSLEKVRFQEEALKVAKAQTELNEAMQSQLLEATIKLADERSIYIKALSDYNLALCKLNKTVGIKDYFSIM